MTRAEALAILGLPPNASRADAERQFRILAKRHHPDAVPGDPSAAARFARLVAARDRLRDPSPDPKTPPTPSSKTESTPLNAASGPQHHTIPLLYLSADALLSGGPVDAEIWQLCLTCNGTGWRRLRFLFNLPLPCPACDGKGEKRRTIRIRLPTALPPDTLVNVNGRLHRISPLLPNGIRREGPHLITERHLRPGAFRRGTHIACDIPGGRIHVHIPPGLTPGTTLRIPGRGLPDGHGGRGDLRIRLLAIS